MVSDGFSSRGVRILFVILSQQPYAIKSRTYPPRRAAKTVLSLYPAMLDTAHARPNRQARKLANSRLTRVALDIANGRRGPVAGKSNQKRACAPRAIVSQPSSGRNTAISETTEKIFPAGKTGRSHVGTPRDSKSSSRVPPYRARNHQLGQTRRAGQDDRRGVAREPDHADTGGGRQLGAIMWYLASSVGRAPNLFSRGRWRSSTGGSGNN